VVFNQVTVSSQEAGITLEFDDGRSLSAVLREGRILVDGEEVGRFSSGDPLERSWRSLLGRAVAAENGEVAELLLRWSPPEELTGEGARAAEALVERIALALAGRPAPTEPAFPTLSREGEAALFQALLLRPERLRALAELLQESALRDLTTHVGETVRVEGVDDVDGALLVVDGDLLVEGRVRGDVIVVGGQVTLGEEARVDGNLRWLDAEIRGDRNAVRGQIRELVPTAVRTEAELRAELERTIRDSLREAARADRSRAAPARAARVPARSVFRNVFRGISGLFQTAITFVLLVGIGLGVLYFFPRHFETVARTARSHTGKSAAVGLAALVLAFPAWIVGIVVLAVTIIGIPVMLLWLPAFPLAFAAAVVLGYLAVAWNLGRWMSTREFQGLEGFDTSRPAAQIGTGVGLLLAAFAAAHVFRMAGPFLGVFHGLLTAMGVVLSLAVSVVGLGAVILSRGGQEGGYAGAPWDGADDPFAPEPDPFAPASGEYRERAEDPGAGEPAGAPGATGPAGSAETRGEEGSREDGN
jgi:hypothetical protein